MTKSERREKKGENERKIMGRLGEIRYNERGRGKKPKIFDREVFERALVFLFQFPGYF